MVVTIRQHRAKRLSPTNGKSQKNIGEVYTVTVGDIDFGDVVTLATGKQHKVGKFDFIELTEDGALLTAYALVADPRQPVDLWVREEIFSEFIVPEGDPIVSIFSRFWNETLGEYEKKQVTEENNIKQDSITPSFDIRIDRAVDYNLPIYCEYQVQKRAAFGGEVTRYRFFNRRVARKHPFKRLAEFWCHRQ